MSAVFDFVNGASGRFAIKQGETISRDLFWKNDTDGAPVSLAGYTAKMQARKNVDAAAVLNLTTENSGIVLGENTGKISLQFTAAITAAIEPGIYFYDLFLIFEEKPICFLEGRIEFTRAVTQ